jgi:hypothetical protein
MSTSPRRFSEEERRVLLQEPRIGPIVLERLEAAGFNSLDQLRQAGAQAAVQRVCLQTGQVAWRNRRRPLERLLQRH